MKSINPATGRLIKAYEAHSNAEVNARIGQAQHCFGQWRHKPFSERAELMRQAAGLLREQKDVLAQLISDEMGKILKDSLAEIEKCASACDYYADHAEAMLRDDVVKTDARKSFVTYQPLGVILAIMPWNFPFWQVFRFAAPNLMAGNVGLLKHASNVNGCALAIERIFIDAGFPEGVFTTLLVPGKQIEHWIEHPAIRAVTLTGSTPAGKAVAAKAGALLKKTVLELGGSDPYIVFADADIQKAASICAQSRLINTGQSCIAAKRFIVLHEVRREFKRAFIECFEKIKVGVDIGPLARTDLCDALHQQVQQSVTRGAQVVFKGSIPAEGAYFPPMILTDVKPGMPAFDQELFGPVAAIIEAKDEEEAFSLANATEFGLGSAIFSENIARAEIFARTHLDAGQVFINAMVRSDARLPFGGIKESGYGREMGAWGIREFTNVKTVWVD